MFNIFKHSPPEENKPAGIPAEGLSGGEPVPPPAAPEEKIGADEPVGPVPPPEPVPPDSPVEPPVATPPPLQRHGVVYKTLSPETRTGRFMRPLLRWLAAIVGLFALGLLAGYLLLYQPAQKQLDSALLQLNQLNQNITQKDKSQVSAQTDRDQALKSLQQAQADLKKASSENDLLVVLSGVNSARVSLVNKDGQTAKNLIDQSQADLTRALVYIETQDKTRADLLRSRLELASKELVSDPQAALADLDRLAADLNDVRLKLFKK